MAEIAILGAGAPRGAQETGPSPTCGGHPAPRGTGDPVTHPGVCSQLVPPPIKLDLDLDSIFT